MVYTPEFDSSIHYKDLHRRSIHKVPADLSKFWCITVVTNPERFKRRYELYWRFAEMCESAGIRLITVEEAFGNRQWMVTDPDNKYHLQLRSNGEIWRKENCLNLGIKHACAIAPDEVREVAWIDADCRPASTPRHWFEETWHQLQHYKFVQMWEQMADLDVNHNMIGTPQPGFMANYVKYGTPTPEQFWQLERDQEIMYPTKSKIFGRPGLAWAANLESLNQVGGLIDYAVLGAGDWYMAHGLVGSLESARSEYAYGPYMAKMLQWQERAQRWIKRDVGYVPGMVYHDFHGRKALRQYGLRGKILRDAKYDPETDLKYDSQGLIQLEVWEPRQMQLRDDIRAYFRARSEDSIDLA